MDPSSPGIFDSLEACFGSLNSDAEKESAPSVSQLSLVLFIPTIGTEEEKCNLGVGKERNTLLSSFLGRLNVVSVHSMLAEPVIAAVSCSPVTNDLSLFRLLIDWA